MSDRTREIRVILDETTRIDDCEDLITAIEMIRGVGKVELVVSAGMESMGVSIAKMELMEKLYEVVK